MASQEELFRKRSELEEEKEEIGAVGTLNLAMRQQSGYRSDESTKSKSNRHFCPTMAMKTQSPFSPNHYQEDEACRLISNLLLLPFLKVFLWTRRTLSKDEQFAALCTVLLVAHSVLELWSSYGLMLVGYKILIFEKGYEKDPAVVGC